MTGATQGIGLAIARALANEGCTLIVCGRNEKQLRRVERQLARYDVDVLAYACDVRDEQNVADLFQAVPCPRGKRRLQVMPIFIGDPAGLDVPATTSQSISGSPRIGFHPRAPEGRRFRP